MRREWGLGTAAVVAAALLGWTSCAAAQEAPPSPATADQQPQNPHAGGYWERDLLTGDWGGLRTDWESHGVQLGANDIGEILGNLTGGARRGAIYEGRLEVLLNLDLEKIAGWSGATVHANAYQIHGRGLSANDLGNNLLVASNIEAERATRLFDLWLEQHLWTNLVSVRIGQLAADDEFIVSPYASLFVNSTFGFPGSPRPTCRAAGPPIRSRRRVCGSKSSRRASSRSWGRSSMATPQVAASAHHSHATPAVRLFASTTMPSPSPRRPTR